MSLGSKKRRAALRVRMHAQHAANAERGEFPMGEPFQTWKTCERIESGPARTAPGPNAKRNRAKRLRRSAARRVGG